MSNLNPDINSVVVEGLTAQELLDQRVAAEKQKLSATATLVELLRSHQELGGHVSIVGKPRFSSFGFLKGKQVTIGTTTLVEEVVEGQGSTTPEQSEQCTAPVCGVGEGSVSIGAQDARLEFLFEDIVSLELIEPPVTE